MCMFYNMSINISMHLPETDFVVWQTKVVLLTSFFSCTAPTPQPQPAPAQLLLPVDPVDHRHLEDCGFDQDVPSFPPTDDDIDIVLAALLKGLPGIDAEELDGLLKDLPKASYARIGCKG